MNSKSNFWDGLVVGLSLGIVCAVREGGRAKSESLKNDLKNQEEVVRRDIKPMVANMKELSIVASMVYQEAFSKRDKVKRFEISLKQVSDDFNLRNAFDIEWDDMRQEMVKELDSLIKVCDTTIKHTQGKEALFQTIINNIDGAKMLMNLFWQSQAIQ